MVFDKEGHFVPDLKMDQFELQVDGKYQPISFFEMVSAAVLTTKRFGQKLRTNPFRPRSHPLQSR